MVYISTLILKQVDYFPPGHQLLSFNAWVQVDRRESASVKSSGGPSTASVAAKKPSAIAMGSWNERRAHRQHSYPGAIASNRMNVAVR